MTTFIRRLVAALFATALLPGLAHHARAASHTWSGAVNGNFSNAGNWVGGVAPNPAVTNTLTFPAGATRFTITNNIASLKISAINLTGSGYVIRGANVITLTPNLLNILASGTTNTVECPLTFASFGSASVGDNDSLTLSGMLTGSDGFTKAGNGDLFIAGAASNPLTGNLNILAGELYFKKTGGAANYAGNAIDLGGSDVGNLVRLHLGDNNQIPDGATLSLDPSGVLAMNGFTDIVGAVTMHGGIINGTTAGSLLRIDGDLTLTPRLVGTNEFGQPIFESPTLWGAIEFNGASRNINVTTNTARIEANVVETGSATVLNKTGPGTLSLMASNSFTGQLNVQQGTLVAEDFHSLGTASSNTVVSSGASLKIPAAGTLAEPLVLAGAGDQGTGALILDAGGNTTCTGLITLTSLARVFVPPAQQLQFLTVVGGAGGIEKIGLGELALTGASANTFSGASFVNAGTMQLSKPANTRTIASVTVTNGASLVFNNNELMDNAGVLSIYGNASVNLTNRSETISGLNMGRPAVLNTGTGLLTMLGNFYAGAPYSASGISATIRGNLSLGGATRTVSGSDRLDLDCAVSDGTSVGGFWVNDASLYLLRSNSFSGPVIVKGSCGVSNEFALGAAGGGLVLTNGPFGTSHFITLPAYLSITNESLTNYSASYFTHLGGLFGGTAWNGPIVLATTNRLIFDAPDPYHSLLINGQISGMGGLLKARGDLVFSQPNTYTGITEVTAGFLTIRHPQSLGGSGQGTYMGEGAGLSLELPNGSVVSEPLFASDEFLPYTTNFILAAGGGGVTNTWTGPIAMPASWLGMQAWVADSGSLRLDNVISGLGDISKAGYGTLILGGTSPNIFTGTTTVTNGTLVLNKPNGVRAVSNLTVNGYAVVEWAGDEQMADQATLTLKSPGVGGVFTTNALLGSHNETVSNLALHRSYLHVGTGAFTLLGDVDVSNPSSSLWNDCGITGAGGAVILSPGTHRVWTPLPSFYPSTFHGHSPIHEAGGSAGLLIKVSTVLAASNSFTGPIIVEAAALDAHHPYALGSAAQGVLVTNQGSLYLRMTNNTAMPGEAIVLAAQAPGEFFASELHAGENTTNSWGGPLTLLGSNRVDVGFGSKFTLTGTVHGPGSMRRTGGGELVLAGSQPNTFNGLSMDDASRVRLAKPPGVNALTGDVLMDGDGIENQLILDASNQFPPQTAITVGYFDAFATFNLNGHAATIRQLSGVGAVVGNGILTINTPPAGYDTEFAGPVTSTIVKQGPGKARFTEYVTGDLFVQGGLLTIYDEGIASQTVISPGAALYAELSVFNFGALSGAGTFFVWGQGILGAASGGSTFTGSIIGTNGNASLVKAGAGALTLTGPVSGLNNVAVTDGTLLVNTVMTNPVGVGSIAPGFSQTLGGTGTVGNVTVTGLGARISPGATTNVPSYGKLTVNNLTLTPGGHYRCDIGGTNAGVNLDQINATGTVTLGGGFTDFAAFGTGATSNRYVIVKAANPVSGTFLNDPEGDTYAFGAGRTMTLTYLPNGGRDITLIEQPNPVPNIGGIERGKNGNMTITGTGLSGALYDIQSNTNLNTTNWIVIGTVTGDINGAISFTDTNAPAYPQRFFRFRLQ
jgi:autotransporter-associated beta strand protein